MSPKQKHHYRYGWSFVVFRYSAFTTIMRRISRSHTTNELLACMYVSIRIANSTMLLYGIHCLQ